MDLKLDQEQGFSHDLFSKAGKNFLMAPKVADGILGMLKEEGYDVSPGGKGGKKGDED